MSHRYGYFPALDAKNSGFRVHEIKRLLVLSYYGLVYTHPSMAANLPCLTGSSCINACVLTSFVLPVHNQGVSLAPKQGHALWKKFLPTTGSSL